jgi:hypothetical protein
LNVRPLQLAAIFSIPLLPVRPVQAADTVAAPVAVTSMVMSKGMPNGTSARTVLLVGVTWLKSWRKPRVIFPLFQNTLIAGLSSSFTCICAITTFCAELTRSSTMRW